MGTGTRRMTSWSRVHGGRGGKAQGFRVYMGTGTRRMTSIVVKGSWGEGGQGTRLQGLHGHRHEADVQAHVSGGMFGA